MDGDSQTRSPKQKQYSWPNTSTRRHHADDHPASDIVALNAGAAIYAAGCAHSLEDGVEAAWEAMESGEAMEKLDALARLTQELKGD